MNPQARHERLQEFFLSARRLSDLDRVEFINANCADDLVLRNELEQLLKHDALPEELQKGAGEGFRGALEALRTHPPHSREAGLPTSIGNYRILSKLGEGGMGTVYEALQENPQRTVALKVLRPALVSSEALRRFEHEGAFLARLQHPGIAQIYDSGRARAEFGEQPYFAMELVKGESLTTYAASHELSARERLELLARVADAVQHAHLHGVIHRDLKPDNILVDSSGQPKILDFGIARASDSDVQLTTMCTDVGQILGTLAYMSPEQASGNPAVIDARSDVYALGLMLHELLTGRLPYDVSHKNLAEALRVIQEDEPQRLGTSHSSHRGDVETIALVALEKDKNRRYVSAAALAADLRHYLNDEPIEARPASRIYTLKKFVRRNKTIVVAVVLVLVSLLGGLIASLRFGLREAERSAEVLRLSALQEVEDRVAEADALWPLHPDNIERYSDWIADSADLVARLPEYAQRLALLRQQALPLSNEEAAAERSDHPSFVELLNLQGEIAHKQQVLRQVRDGVSVPLPELTDDETDPWLLSARADEYVHPWRNRFGSEPLGLALAMKAHELAGPELAANTAVTLAWAYFAVGRDEEASRTLAAAANVAPAGHRESVSAARAALESEIEARNAPQWMAQAEAHLASLEQRRGLLLAETGRRTQWHFLDDNREDRWWNNQMDKLVRELQALETGLLAEDGISPTHGWSVPKRLRFCEHLRNAMAPVGEYAQRWLEALPAIREAYPELEIQPQIGLLPIGADPESGLWEFAHLASGLPPIRAESGSLQRTESTGIVFVLLHGGRFWMGGQNTDPGAPNYDREAGMYDSPVHEVQISPFFISKYEVTQAQWLRLHGTNPSRDNPDMYRPNWNEAGLPGNLLHPVEQVSWSDCQRLCERFGMTLPTECQWEYAARAGTSSTWWTGDEPEDLQYAANLADAYCKANDGPDTWICEAWSDGQTSHAPVGSFAPNPWGLHDMAGNVWEWCLDGYDESVYARPFAVDPIGSPDVSMHRLKRGGSFDESAKLSSSFHRDLGTLGSFDYDLGLRPARRLEP